MSTQVSEPAPVLALDPEALHRAVDSRDPRFDGQVFLGVTSTGIYCRPSCPARRPLRKNRRFYASAASAVAAGYRACRVCRPDALPGTREWDHRGDLAARALQLIGAGRVDEVGVSGLAADLSLSERHLHRVLVAEVGAGPLQLARSRRAQTARLLIDQTRLPLVDVAFAAGFSSVRQFNDVMRAEFGAAPSALRSGRPADDGRAPSAGSLVLRLRLREPFDGRRLLRWFEQHAVAGLEEVPDGALARVVNTAHGPAVIRARPEKTHLAVALALPDLADLSGVVAGVRRTWDLDADPAVVEPVLTADPLLAGLVAQRPGLRVPGCADGFEVAARAVLGQQVSVRAARTLTARLVDRCGVALEAPVGTLTRAFPSADAVATEDLDGLGLTRTRERALRELSRAVAAGLRLAPGVDREHTRARLLLLPGIGPWTADYVALRALGDPDAWLPDDLVLRRAVERRGADPDRWRPWRAYAAMHLWTHDALEAP